MESPPSWAGQLILSQSTPEPRHAPGTIRKQSIRQRHLLSDMGLSRMSEYLKLR